MGPDAWNGERAIRRSFDRTVFELRSICEAMRPSWALLTEIGRGPSLPELKSPSIRPYIDLSTIFLSKIAFDEQRIKRVATGVHVERWSTGWLLSSSRRLGASGSDNASFSNQVWSILREWRHNARSP
jgi:hypothetical protein